MCTLRFLELKALHLILGSLSKISLNNLQSVFKKSTTYINCKMSESMNGIIIFSN